MDISSSSLQLQDSSAFLLDCENLLDQSYAVSDAGYYSACSSLSPASSVDSFSFSPPAFSCRVGQDVQENFSQTTISTQGKAKAQAPKRTGRPRSKFPGVKRQNASEREKLRMRDLTKALQHLRTYLPPSVAPAGKTLTKIETLRLAIEYISSLSEQLGNDFETNQGTYSEQTEMHQDTRYTSAPTLFDNINEVPSLAQSSPAQQFSTMTYQYPVESDLLSFQAQGFWLPQQHHFFHGHC